VDADRNTISENISTGNGDWGIEINNAACDNNIVLGNIVVNNVAGQILDNGTGTDAAHNITS